MRGRAAVTSDVRDGVRPSRADIVFYAVLLVLTALLLVRAAYGMEWYGDEAYAMGTPMRYAAGDHPIVESWESHFSSGMLLTPFVWALERATPGGTGLVLRFRYVFVLLQALYVLALWRIVRPLVPPWAAVLTAAAAFVYLPYFYVFPYYNSIMVPAFVLATLLLLRGFHEGEPRAGRWFAASGVMAGVGIIAYPTMLLAVPFFCAGLVAQRRAQPIAARAPVLGFLTGLGVTLGVFAAITLVASGFSHLAEALPPFLHPVDRDMSLHAIVSRLARTWSVLIAPALATAVFILAAMIARLRRRSMTGPVLAAVVAALASAFVVYRLRLPFISYLDMPQAAALGVGVVVPLLMLFDRDETSATLFRLLCVPAFGVALGTLLASHEGFETAAMPAVIVLIATSLALAARTDPREGMATDDAGRWRAAGIVALGGVALFFLGILMQYTGGDGAVRQLDTRIASGPYAGVRTTAESAARYAAYMKALAPLHSSSGRIAFVEEFPQGYLFSGRRPGTYSVWTTFATGDRWQRYLDITGDYPDDIVATRFIGPNGGIARRPFAPPFGLAGFETKYRETFRDADFVFYERVGR
jgi:hypothetical protein